LVRRTGLVLTDHARASNLNRLTFRVTLLKVAHSLPHHIGAPESVFRRILQMPDQGGSRARAVPELTPALVDHHWVRPGLVGGHLDRSSGPDQAAVKTAGPLRRHAFGDEHVDDPAVLVDSWPDQRQACQRLQASIDPSYSQTRHRLTC
jgi:hypothetical protein